MHIRPGTWIGIAALVWAAIGYASGETTLAFSALAWGSIILFLHRIEVKLNRLLDDRGITVRDTDD